MSEKKLPTTWAELEPFTSKYAVGIRRPGLTDPFGRPKPGEYGYVLTLAGLDNQTHADYIGFGITLDEAIRDLHKNPVDH